MKFEDSSPFRAASPRGTAGPDGRWAAAFRRLAGAACAAALAGSTTAQVNPVEVPALDGVAIEQKLGAALPADATFLDSEGREVRFGDLFDGELPVVLTLNYTDCPMLCNVHLSMLVTALAEFAGRLQPGTGYRLVTLSIDPKDTPERAARMKAERADAFAHQWKAKVGEELSLEAARAGANAGWTFLVGDERNIARVADAVGFGFKWVAEQQEFAHQAANIVCTADGRVARYLSGIDPMPGILRMSLVEASEGKIGTLFDEVFLSCFVYDPLRGSYALAARRLMMAGGVVMVVVILTGFYFLKRSESRTTTPPAGGEEAVR